MSEVKRFKIIGQIKKGKTLVPFTVQYDAIKQDHATQRLYSEMGSRHRARRFEIMIKSVQEVAADVAAADK
ncbi:MAG TPA: 50S ribosomal protein L18Ae [Candidatus Bathyarchaeia archaeon]|nr:50S ribosomal protein L18Ae [Candidatus Bathyarchaeia archaeon]